MGYDSDIRMPLWPLQRMIMTSGCHVHWHNICWQCLTLLANACHFWRACQLACAWPPGLTSWGEACSPYLAGFLGMSNLLLDLYPARTFTASALAGNAVEETWLSRHTTCSYQQRFFARAELQRRMAGPFDHADGRTGCIHSRLQCNLDHGHSAYVAVSFGSEMN